MAAPGGAFKACGVITLTSDFGLQDPFVGVMKGQILGRFADARIIDLTHEVLAHWPVEAGFWLARAYRYFPSGTVHVAVVDPGVGGPRGIAIVEGDGHIFLAPDNGLLGSVVETLAVPVLRQLSDGFIASLGVTRPSATFHGRDIFAPVAAALSKRVRPEDLGALITDEVRLKNSLNPEVLKNGDIKGRIIHIDRFGNCVTNLTRDLIDPRNPPTLLIKGETIRTFQDFYSSALPNTLFAIWGSAGFLEISINRTSAAKILRAKRGDTVIVRQD